MLAKDIRFAWRGFVQNPGITVVAIAAIAVGIGLNSAVFTLVNAVLLNGPAFDDPDRVVVLSRSSRTSPGNFGSMSYLNYRDISPRLQSYSAVTVASVTSASVADSRREPDSYSLARISTPTFGMLGQKIQLGRDFTPADGEPGAEPVAIIGSRVWQNRYGSDPAVVGQTVRINGITHTVIGVMPQGFRFPMFSDLWTPFHPRSIERERRDFNSLEVFGRLAPSATIESANAEIAALNEALVREYPATNKDTLHRVSTFNERYNGGPIRLIFLAMLGAVGFVLLIACANVANLMLSRSVQRQRETAIRTALGASRSQIVRQLLVESLVLSFIGGLLGLGLAWFGVRAFDNAVAGVDKPYWIQFQMDFNVFAYFAVICAATGIVFGLAPALHASRSNLNDTMKDGGRGSAGKGRTQRLSGALVIAEISLTIVLLAGAGLLIRSFFAVQSAETGYKAEGLTTAFMVLADARYPEGADRQAFVERILERLRAVPGVQAAAVSSHSPLRGFTSRSLTLADRVLDDVNGRKPQLDAILVSPGFFEAVGVTVLRGRDFTASDGLPGSEVMLVNERLGALYWPGQDPVGKRVRLGDDPASPWVTIVGIAPPIRQGRFREVDVPPLAVLPYRQQPTTSLAILVRTPAGVPNPAAAIRREVSAVDPDQPVFRVETLRQVAEQATWQFRIFGTAFGVFAIIAMSLSAVGMYALTAYSVSQRTSEIGLRMALGADQSSVLWLVTRRGLVQLAAGLGIGLIGALGAGQLLSSVLFRVQPWDPVTLAGISIMLTAVTIAACAVPARRASGIDPLEALRVE